MKKQQLFILVCAFFGASNLRAQQALDVLHYHLSIAVSDTSDRIVVHEEIQLKAPASTQVVLDLGDPSLDGKGMRVTQVKQHGKSCAFKQLNEHLIIDLAFASSDTLSFEIDFSGIPKDGLIIGKNKYKQRTFFADNWPNRAHQWYACHDHPIDRATYTYVVSAPAHYSVVANGVCRQEVIAGSSKIWTYECKVPIPAKVAVIGVAEMRIEKLEPLAGHVNQPTIYSAVYLPHQKEALDAMASAPKIMAYFDSLLAPYPLEQLFNVQSTTRYGGMENAGCIFYDEKALKGKGSADELIAHEIAHQWFGNTVTETEWKHLWLTEGFATYFENCYLQYDKGQEAFVNKLKFERAVVINFCHQAAKPMVDGKSEVNALLNANSYQKGAWVLHMLRIELGDSLFFEGIRQYYETYKLGNASSEDFWKVMASTSGRNLDAFFKQWLYQDGLPQLQTSLVSSETNTKIYLEQKQAALFQFPLRIELLIDGKTVGELNVKIDARKNQVLIPAQFNDPKLSIRLDPKTELLFEMVNNAN
ncbi:MAG: hypothetical protein RLZZ301_723 [Bacteroidota bacterium]|jgi:aminopeptidase N